MNFLNANPTILPTSFFHIHTYNSPRPNDVRCTRTVSVLQIRLTPHSPICCPPKLTYLLHELQPRVDLINNDRIRVFLPVGTRLRHDLPDRPSANQIHLYIPHREEGGEKQIKRLDSHLGCSTGRSGPVAPIDTGKSQKSVHSNSINVQPSVTTRRTKRLI